VDSIPAQRSTVALRLAPLSPAFVGHLAAESAGVSGGVRDDGSLAPMPIDFSYLEAERLAAASASYPARYDLRSLGKLPPIGNEGQYNACWAFAALDSLESCLLPGDPESFSQDNLLLASGFDGASYDSSGNDLEATAYLARWAGPVSAAAESYGAGAIPPGLLPLKHVQEVLILPPRSGPHDNGVFKWAVMTYGAVDVALYADAGMTSSTDSAAYRVATSAYYYASPQSPNHAVDIVGWNDAYPASNFATRPPGNGAFLVRNSWGSSWGSGGYFWVSYYDAVIGKQDNAVFDDAESPANYSRIYQYDPLGWTRQAGIGYASTSAWFANEFRASASEQLVAVSFYTATAAARYRVYVSLGGLQGKHLAATGTLGLPGYHTVQLLTPLQLVAGRPFAVAVKLTTPGSRYPIPLEERISGYSDAASAAPGQSFISSNGVTWTDLTTVAGQRESNVCLKAFTR
jgi:C1A family cysteine protease